ncbi:hypothetical protein Aperf_G00000091093 [Anoplocephala perfoliata]
MARALGWYDHSVFYRFRARFSVLFFGCSVGLLPFLCLAFYVIFFLYPLFWMIFGHPVVGTYSSYCFLVNLIYTIFWIHDIDTPFRGGRRSSWLRGLPIWRWMSQYFPAHLVISEELLQWSRENGHEISENGKSLQLPTSVNYLFGYHPHGPLVTGALMAYGSEALNFSKIFPGITPYLATLNVFYHVPFYRDYVMTCGGISVSWESLFHLLDKDITGTSGNLVAVSVGGASEVLESRPGQYVLILSRRRGFFRLALKTGAHLVPSIGFGETNMYKQVANPKGSRLRAVQDWVTKVTTLPPVLFCPTRIIPNRRPVTVVVGRPMVCEQISEPTEEDVDKLREEYKLQLVKLFNKYRPLYDPTAEDIRFI